MKPNLFARVLAFLLTLTFAVSLAACAGGNGGEETTAGTTAGEVTTEDATVTTTEAETTEEVTTEEVTTEEVSGTEATETTTEAETTGEEPEPELVRDYDLEFNGTTCKISDKSAVTVSGKVYTIVKGGIYLLTGTLSDGQIRVDVPKTEQVNLLFGGFSATSSTTAPLYVQNADKVVIELLEGTVNSLTDAAVYQYESQLQTKPNACLYSDDDLTIKGKGTLTVTSNFNNGIGCKNDIKIKNGNITVVAPNNIIKGNGSVTIEGGKLDLSGGEDAIKADSDKVGKGFVLISADAEIDISCTDDAIQALQSVTVEEGAVVRVNSADQAINCDGTVSVAEGTVLTKKK